MDVLSDQSWRRRRHLIAVALVAVAAAVLLLALAEPAPAKRIVGTNGADRLAGTAAADKVKGLRGNDRLKGRGGKDRLSGGPGRDRLNAVDGKRDRAVKGGPGKDVCKVDAADVPRMKGCEKAKVKGGGQNCVVVNEPRPRREMLRGDVPPVFSDAFFAITMTLNVSADGLTGDEIPIAIEEVCDVPPALEAEAGQLVGGDGIALVGPDTKVFDATGQQLEGDAATTALAGADALTLRARLKRPAQWRQNEKGDGVPTFETSRADITD
jgi:Ca2+-binding RTX toxin-like protein